MTSPRQAVWYTNCYVTTSAMSLWEFEIEIPLGTIQRVVATVDYRTDDTPPGGRFDLLWAYALNIGTAGIDPLAVGTDDTSVMMHRCLPLLNTGGGTTMQGPRPLERWDIDSQRIVAAPNGLWWAASSPLTGVSFWWSLSIRVLVLLP